MTKARNQNKATLKCIISVLPFNVKYLAEVQFLNVKSTQGEWAAGNSALRSRVLLNIRPQVLSPAPKERFALKRIIRVQFVYFYDWT